MSKGVNLQMLPPEGLRRKCLKSGITCSGGSIFTRIDPSFDAFEGIAGAFMNNNAKYNQ